jgi:hypothetical protein
MWIMGFLSAKALIWRENGGLRAANFLGWNGLVYSLSRFSSVGVAYPHPALYAYRVKRGARHATTIDIGCQRLLARHSSLLRTSEGNADGGT